MKLKYQMLKKLIFSLLFFLVIFNVSGAYLNNFPVTVTQPNGKVLNLFASGDEYYNWLHDQDNFTIIQNHQSGYWEYAKKIGDELFPSGFVAGSVDPFTTGLQPGLNISAEKIALKRKAVLSKTPAIKTLSKTGKYYRSSGNMNNLVIYIRFADQNEYTDDTDYYCNQFNKSTDGYNSMYNYYKEVSYNKLHIKTHFFPLSPNSKVISFKDSNNRNYYMPYDSSTNPTGYIDTGNIRRDREFALLKSAVAAIGSQIPPNLNIDYDNDGNIDNICFIIEGGPTAWSTLLWPHMWVLYSDSIAINGKRVWGFNFQLETSLKSSGVGVLCHEMFHSLGSPDLYHYTGNGINPVGSWDIMEYNANPPQSMGAFMKFKYGQWIDSIPEIKTSGKYSLHPIGKSFNNAYKIASPNSPDEYFVVEYRQKTGTFESSVPGTGLLVYRINPNPGDGNADGPPDEVYIFRPGGDTNKNGNINLAHFSANTGRTEINNLTDPFCFLQNGTKGGLDIFNVSLADTTISFNVWIDSLPKADFTSNYTRIKPGVSINFNDASRGNPNAWKWYFPGGNPATSTSSTPSIVYNAKGTYPVSLKVWNKSGNDSISKTSYIVVSDLAITIGADQRIVCGSSIQMNPTLFYTGSKTLKYRWSPSAGLNDSTILKPYCSPLTTTNYILTVSDSIISGSDTIEVAVDPLQLTSSYISSVFCGNSVNLNASTNIPTGDFLRVNSPSISKLYANPSSFGSTMQSKFTKGDLLYIKDNSNNYYGCSGSGYPTNIFNGKIALIDRGVCEFGVKALNAQQAGAIGVIITNNTAGAGTTSMGPGAVGSQVSIPSIMISYEDGLILKNLLAAGTVNISMGYDCDNLSFSWNPTGYLSATNIPNPVASPLVSTKYTLTANSGSCSAHTDVNVDITPTVFVKLPEDSTICYGNKMNLDAGNPGLNFIWSTGANTQQIDADTAAFYWVTVSRPNGCFATDSVQVGISFIPLKADRPGGDSSLCFNPPDNLYFSGKLQFADLYNWILSPSYAGILNKNQEQVIISWNDTFSGKAELYLRAENSCGNGIFSDSLEIMVKAAVPQPTISWDYDAHTLTSSNGDSYQWYDQNGIISGADKKTYIPLTSGTYSVVVTVQGCVSVPSKTFSINTAIPENPSIQEISVYPNPSDGNFSIEISAGLPDQGNLTLVNTLGKEIQSWVIEAGKAKKTITFSSSNLPEDIYFIQLKTEGITICRKIIILHF